MVRRAVEQQTLLPFFSKHQGVNPTILPETQSQLIHHEDSQVPHTPAEGFPAQSRATEHTPEAIPDGLHGAALTDRDGKTQAISLPLEATCSNGIDAATSHRRKRCKITDSENTSPATLYSSSNCKQAAESHASPATSQSGHIAEVQFTKGTISGPSTGPNPENQNLTTSDKRQEGDRKTMRLRLDSKLLSSFPPGGNSESTQLRQSSRKSSRLNTVAKFINRVKIVKMTYNSNETPKQNIGQVIDDIMSGRTTYSAFKGRAIQPKLEPRMQPTLTGSPKPTHPFFLPKSQHQTSLQAPQSSDTAPHSAPTAATLLQDLMQPKAKNSTSASRVFSPLSFPSTVQKPRARGEGESHDPIWPSRGMVHARGPIKPIDPPPRINFERRKAKQSTVFIPETETVLSTISLFSGEPGSTSKRQHSKALRRPKKHVLKCDEFKTAVIEKLGVCNPGQGEQSPLDTLPQTSHPALVKLASSLDTATSSFDRGEYDNITWPQKYAPKTAAEALLVGSETSVLRSWLQHHEVSAVNTGLSTNSPRQTPDSKAVRKKKRKKPKDLDGFIVSSEDEDSVMSELQNSDEDELAGAVTVPTAKSIIRSNDFGANSTRRPAANTILISGPSGCGKTAAVYAVAGELGFEVFEINASARRSARDIVERVGDMTQNHLVQLLSKTDGGLDQVSPGTLDNDNGPKQSTMASFFVKRSASKPTNTNAIQKPPRDESTEPSKSQINQKQSLILLEEVDILFNEDKQFWSGVLALIGQSKRPIIMTCTDESILPLESLALHAILRLQPPPTNLAADYMLLLCANEGHLLDRKAILDLYIALGKDLRATIMQLNFWCQMGVGSRKSGLDWMVSQEALDLRNSGDLFRTVSSDTYMEGMGWYSADTVVGEQDHLELRLQLLTEGMNQWGIGLTSWLETGSGRISGGLIGQTDSLEQMGRAADIRSCLDLMCDEEYHGTKYPLDPSIPPIPEKQRLDYIEGYQLLQSDHLRTEYDQLSVKIGATLSVLAETVLSSAEVHIGEQDDILEHVLERAVPQRPKQLYKKVFQDAFQAIIEPPDYSAPVSGLRPLSFEHGTSVIAEDVAPYIRHIVSFEKHLEQYRLQLSGVLPQEGPPSKRPRTTRASRAAVEGLDKASIRRGRWFSGRVIPEQVMATGGTGWETILQYPPTVDLAEIQTIFAPNRQLWRPAPAGLCDGGML
ncbi:hypothetical protein McanMca71_005713 [Microsporum canis]|uniref:AAA+ ATPase domain-containing protein n=1 Tax=Arthroderma otae (strain ATCC MYA-4605 / CBS 113480) TaxID=554155 RepID=C5FML0_ARTOC|nr:conserved hypothetical protein [Microsporum canis CBS 113480]EEQ31113.1 conserved hypothetical protein [Microsporum canis CBS 113480]